MRHETLLSYVQLYSAMTETVTTLRLLHVDVETMTSRRGRRRVITTTNNRSSAFVQLAEIVLRIT